MKKCPQCKRVYDDEKLNFCLDDGEWLQEVSSDEPATAILTLNDTAAEAPTRTLRTNKTSEISVNRSGSFRYAVSIAAVVAVLAAGFIVYRYQSPRSAKQIESVAVLPFVNTSGNPDVDYLSDGITESLISSLSKVPGLTVKARSSVFTYKGRDVTPQQVASDLDVQTILNGRVAQRGDQITLNLELTDPSTSNILWSEQYVRKMTDLTSLQSEIARDVSGKLQSKLSGTDQQNVTKNYTQNTEAYQLYLKGKYFWNKRTADDLKKSVEFFQRAADTDPTYALAFSGLAEAYILFPNYLNEAPQVAYPRAKAAAERALQLDPSLAEATAALGVISQDYEWNFEQSRVLLERAIELNPNYATGHQWYGEYLLVMSRYGEALQEIKKAHELDPLSIVINALLGVAYRLNGQPDLAIDQLKKTIEIDPKFPRSYAFLAEAYLAIGMFNEATDQFVKGSLASGNPPERVTAAAARLRESYKIGGAPGFYRVLAELLDSARKTEPLSPPPATAVAGYYVQAGEPEKALEILEEAYRLHDPDLIRMHDPIFEPIKNDARYKDLAKRVGLPGE